MKTKSLEDLPELTAGSRKQVWSAAEHARLRLRPAQRKCFLEDPFQLDSGGRHLDTDSASVISIEYAQAYFQAISSAYLRLQRPYRRLSQLLTTAMKFVCSETTARWKALEFDDRMTFESICLPEVRAALLDRRDQFLAQSLQQKSEERRTVRDFAMDPFTFFKEPRPLGDNPHPPESSLWDGFEQATYEAKKELDNLWSDCTRRYAGKRSPSEVLALILDARMKRLDIVAKWMLRIFVAEEETARLYEDWIADLMRAEENDVLDLVREKTPRYGEYFNYEEFTETLLLRQQSYKEKSDSKVIRLIRERRAAHAVASTPLEPNRSAALSATANPHSDEIYSNGDRGQPSDTASSLANPGGTPIDYANVWLKYQAGFQANLESLEAMAFRSDPLHLPLDEQDAQRFATNAAEQRFDELAEVEYLEWVDSGLPYETFSARLAGLHAQVSEALAKLWSVGSDILRQWCERSCQSPADGALSGRSKRWEHRARTTEIVRHISRDHGRAIEGLVVKLEKLAAEEAHEVPNWADERRLTAYVDPEQCRIRRGHTGDFLESVRVVTRDLGIQIGPPNGVLPIHFCLRILLRELVCEREPLSDPQIDRLDDEQLQRYLWAPYSGNSITPDSGQILNLCEALKWYCQRLRALCQFEFANGKTSETGKKRPEAVTKRDVDPTNRKGRRSAWLKKQLAGHVSWSSDLDIGQAGGPAYNTIQRYRSGRKSTRDVYVRRLLAKVFNCDITDVPE